MKRKIWHNVTVATINEALRIGRLKLDGSLINEVAFSHALGAYHIRARLVSLEIERGPYVRCGRGALVNCEFTKEFGADLSMLKVDPVGYEMRAV